METMAILQTATNKYNKMSKTTTNKYILETRQ